ncbi:sigma factor-like helix-turn-helix DNA-binding protein [Microbacterium foliorum]|uniref:sigma factor-like helix-turn-helix DNA-binding protein n=1 Tax=Rothia terrae TaxID=396015 RepID=UPI00343B9FB7
MNYPSIKTALAETNTLCKELTHARTIEERTLILTQLLTIQQRFALLLAIERENALITLLDEENLSYAQAGKILGISTGRVGQIVYAAQKRAKPTL